MAVKEETRKLVAHEKLLIDVIKKQAGSLKKAILEGTMNSVEAGATEIDIKFRAERTGPAFLSIYDDGIGIQTKKELTNHFETFGQPHESTENVIWKQFRMGRGQMFAFGKNIWRTSQFRMVVDVDTMELDYILEEGLPEKSGCSIDIELYQNPLKNYSIHSVHSLKEEVKEQVRFVKIPVNFNDEQISINPELLDWDFEDENAYYQFNETSRLKIYNLGVYVKSDYISNVGVGGVIVSKKRLDVNFARNDIQSTCDIYQKIQKIIQDNKIKKANKKYTALTSGQRLSLLKDLRDGRQGFSALKSKRIFETAQGKWLSWNMLSKHTSPWCFTPVGNISADKAMEMGVALCLSEDIPYELGYTGPMEKFFDWLFIEQFKTDGSRDIYNQNIYGYEKIEAEEVLERLRGSFLLYDGNETTNLISAKKLQDMFKEEFKYIPPNKLTKSDKLFIQAMQSFPCWGNRTIRLGLSTVANAWTDGSSFIAFDKGWLKGLNLTCDTSILRLFQVGCHEMVHDNDTAGSHLHGPDYYEKYYEITEKSYNNPFYYVYQFAKKMKSCRIENKRMEEDKKEQDAKEKLGLAASIK